MLIASICSRETIVTFRGTSRMSSSVPNTEEKGREVGRICWSIGTPVTWYCSIVVMESLEGAADTASAASAHVIVAELRIRHTEAVSANRRSLGFMLVGGQQEA